MTSKFCGRHGVFKTLMYVLTFAGLSGGAFAQLQFNDVSSDAGITFSGESYGSSWGDVNGDGYPEIFANNHRQQPSLYLNLGNGGFLDMASSVDTWVAYPTRDTHGGAFGDIDNDGDLDLFVATGYNQPNQLFINAGGLLTDHAVEYGVTGIDWGANMPSWFDLDNDGMLDFMIGIHDGNSGLFLRVGDQWSRRNGGYGYECFSSRVGLLSDLNLDGRTELMCSVFNTPLKIYDYGTRPMLDKSNILPSANQSNDAIWADFNGDLRPDLFFLRGVFQLSGATLQGNKQAEAYLAANSGIKSFEFSAQPGSVLTVFIDWKRMGFLWNVLRFGASGNGPPSVGSRTTTLTLDSSDEAMWGYYAPIDEQKESLYIGYDPAAGKWKFALAAGNAFNTVHMRIGSTTNLGNLQTSGFGGAWEFHHPRLYLNIPHPSNATGDPSFSNGTSTAQASGLGTPIQGIGAAAADFDNDMDLDIYVVTRGGAKNTANLLYRNNGNGQFTQVAGAAGAAGPIGANLTTGAGSGGQVTIGDYDVDGFVDLFLTNGVQLVPLNAGGPSKLIRNTSAQAGNSNHWLLIDLAGTASNRDGIGAIVHVTTPDNTIQLREQNGGYHRTAQNHMRLHFGLGSNNKADVTVRWPSGQVDTHLNVAADGLYTAIEGGAITRRTIGGPPPSIPGDSDGDGLSNQFEQSIGTNPFNPDSDGGGANDGEEFNAGYDPLDNSDDNGLLDDDNDGLSNADELARGTDPANPDTDGGGVIDGEEVNLGLDPLNAADDSSSPIDVCGEPAINNQSDAGTFLWKDCDGSGRWHLRVSGGGTSSSVFYEGEFAASGGLTSVTGVSIEATDTLDSSQPNRFRYVMKVWNTGTDGMDFNAPANTCYTPTAPLSDPVYLGATRRLLISNGLNLSTLAACGAPPPPPPAADVCGEPSINGGSESGTFLWKDCAGNGRWHLRVSGGGTSTGLVYDGRIDADNGVSALQGVGLEANDVVSNQPGQDRLLYEIRVWGGGVDGFDFNAPAGACYTPGGPSNQPVYLGNGKTPLAGSNLDLSSYNSCAPPLDSDGDGLSNAQETALGTNPFVADTDGGGVDDGTEVQSGTNPLNPSDDNIGASDVCGDPGINNNSDTGTYLWKDCDGSERWHLRVARGGIQSGQQYIGRVQIPGGPLSLSPYNLEASDVLDNSSNSNRISYVLNVWGLGIDGFDFTPRANSCFTPEDPLSESVYLGASRIVMAPASLNLSTLDGC